MSQSSFWKTPNRSIESSYTLQELRTQLGAIKQMGYVKSVYKHAGGIGNTLEQLLCVRENNLALPDLGTLELKARRRQTGSMITLFTKSPNRYSNTQLLKEYGYPSGGKLKIHQTVYFGKPNAQGFILKREDDELQCWNEDNCLGTYSLEFLHTKFLEKVGDGVILTLAGTQLRTDGWEEFHYQDAYLLKGVDFEGLLMNLRYDIRIGRYPDGRVHDHGSAFRVRFADLGRIFSVYDKLL